MGACCARVEHRKSSGPKVAMIGATGYVGQFIVPKFLDALNEDKLLELRVLTTKSSDIVKTFADKGAKVFVVDFSKVKTLVSALSGVDVVVSTLGTRGTDLRESRSAILEALEVTNVKIYFPSEFGINHYKRCKLYTHPDFEGKRQHFRSSQDKGIKTIGILCSLIMEHSFGSWLGLDIKHEIWTLVGNPERLPPVALTAENDVARFTLEAVLKSFGDPINFPEVVEIYSELKTMKHYAEIFDAVAGRPTKLEFTSIEKAAESYKISKHDFVYLLQILMGEGAFDCTDTSGEGNELLNPEQSLWKLKTIHDYAEETKGRPGAGQKFMPTHRTSYKDPNTSLWSKSTPVDAEQISAEPQVLRTGSQ